MASPLARLVGPALEAARRALRDLDADQVPADLRKVAAHSGALTPPLATSLLRALDRYEWLRVKAVEVWPGAGVDSADEGTALGTLFLERPPGWSERLSGAVAAAERAGAAEAERGNELRVARLEREVADARARLRDERRRAGRERERLASELEEARAALGAVRSGELRSAAAWRRRAEAAERASAAAAAELEEARREAAAARDLYAGERRLRAAAEHSLAETTGVRAWPAGSPEQLALHLDDAALMARPAPGGGHAGDGQEEPGRLCLPPGVAPDGAAAIDWLLARRGVTLVIVDGYNAGFALAGTGDPSAARLRLQVAVDRLPTLAAGSMRVTVVYDSALEPGGETVRRVKTRFAAPGRAADEEIVDLAAGTAGPVVVISGDRVVRERAESVGALALWSSALVEWATHR